MALDLSFIIVRREDYWGNTMKFWFTLIGSLFLMAAKLPDLNQPSFKCTADRILSSAEQLVCQDPHLRLLDQMLNVTYTSALAKISGTKAKQTLAATQRGWVERRDECWKAQDRYQCIKAAYDQRISVLQARYRLARHSGTALYQCKTPNDPTIKATFFQSHLPSVLLQRGDQTLVAIQSISGSGARYLGSFGRVFWIKGNSAQVTWPKGHTFTCQTKD